MFIIAEVQDPGGWLALHQEVLSTPTTDGRAQVKVTVGGRLLELYFDRP